MRVTLESEQHSTNSYLRACGVAFQYALPWKKVARVYHRDIKRIATKKHSAAQSPLCLFVDIFPQRSGFRPLPSAMRKIALFPAA